MKITFEQVNINEPEIIVRGNISSPQVKNIIELLNGRQTLQKMFFFKNDKEYIFDITDVTYFEAENNKTFAYIKNEIYEVHYKLYELEVLGRSKGFVRINKGMVVNINHILSVEAEFGGNYMLILKERNKRLTISRKYIKDFKKYIMEVF